MLKGVWKTRPAEFSGTQGRRPGRSRVKPTAELGLLISLPTRDLLFVYQLR